MATRYLALAVFGNPNLPQQERPPLAIVGRGGAWTSELTTEIRVRVGCCSQREKKLG